METFSWITPEYEDRPRSRDWYWWVGTIGVIGAGASIWFTNYLLGGLLLLATFLVIAFSGREPRDHEITVSSQGIMVDDKMYDIKSIDSFWIAEPTGDRQFARLIIHQKFAPSTLHTYLIAEDVDITSLQQFLLQFISEKEVKESKTMSQLEDLFM